MLGYCDVLRNKDHHENNYEKCAHLVATTFGVTDDDSGDGPHQILIVSFLGELLFPRWGMETKQLGMGNRLLPT